VKYSLGRVGIFVAVIVPVLVLVPLESLPLKLMIGIIVSAVVAFFALRRWREELAQQLTDGARRRQAEQQRLRSALAGEDDQPPPDAEPKGT
jgi:membrane protein implicated in regulation of membrane protease activity